MATNTFGGYSPQQQQLFQPYQQGSNGITPLKKRGNVGKFFLGEQESFQRSPLHTPQGMQLLEQLLSSGSEGLNDPYAGFQPIADQATRQFNSETVPGLAERFTALGGSDTRGSSDFAGQLGGAGANLQSALAALKSEYGMKNRQGLLQQVGLGLTPQFETQHKNRGSGFLEKLLSALGSGTGGIGKAFGTISGQSAGNNSSGNQGGNDASSLITQLLPFLI